MSEPGSSTNVKLLEAVERLSVLIELAFAPQIETGRAALRSDPVDAAILDSVGIDWKPTAKLQKEVATKTGKKTRSIQTHISDLVEVGFLRSQGGGKATEYRSAGVA